VAVWLRVCMCVRGTNDEATKQLSRTNHEQRTSSTLHPNHSHFEGLTRSLVLWGNKYNY